MERRNTVRRKGDRRKFNTSISQELIGMLQDVSDDTGIPMNRLVENALRETYEIYLKNKK